MRDAVIGAQVGLLEFDRPPQPLDEDVVTPGAAAIHADGDLSLLRLVGERQQCKLAALIRVEDRRLAIERQRFLHRLDT